MRSLVREGRLVRLTMASTTARKHHASPLSRCRQRAPGSSTPARQTPDKRNVLFEPTEFQLACNAGRGRSTQVPVNPAVPVNDRFVRRPRYQSTARTTTPA